MIFSKLLVLLTIFQEMRMFEMVVVMIAGVTFSLAKSTLGCKLNAPQAFEI